MNLNSDAILALIGNQVQYIAILESDNAALRETLRARDEDITQSRGAANAAGSEQRSYNEP
jgi:hypothetical protein